MSTPIHQPTKKEDAGAKKSNCLDVIEKLRVNREERRKHMEEVKRNREQRAMNNEAAGIKVDVDFQALVE